MTNKFAGKEPSVFDGTRSKTHEFMTEWNLYCGVNWNNELLSIPFTKALTFLSYIKGENVYEWVAMHAAWLNEQVRGGALVTDLYLYRTIENDFLRSFTDTMEVQKAQSELESIQMIGGDLDNYVAKFERLVRASGYDINDPSMMPKFYKGLPFKLREAIVAHEVGPFTVEEWIEAAHKHQQKYLYLKAV